MASLVIRSFQCEPTERRLAVWFVNGGHSSYFDVSEEIVERMRPSFAKGEFFNPTYAIAFGSSEPPRILATERSSAHNVEHHP